MDRDSYENNTPFIDQLYFDSAAGKIPSQGLCVEFLEASDFRKQLATLQKISHHMTSDASLSSGGVLEALICCYVTCSVKSPVKRPLASYIQNASSVNPAVVKYLLEEKILIWLTSKEHVDIDDKRVIIDNITAMIDKFPLGEEVVVKLSVLSKVVSYLTHALEALHDAASGASSSAFLTKRIYDCLILTQLWAKLFQKLFIALNDSVTMDVLADDVVACFKTLCLIINSESYSMDCRVACGLAMVATVSFMAGENEADCISFLFPELIGKPLLVGQTFNPIGEGFHKNLTVFAKTAIIHGALAILDLSHLVNAQTSQTGDVPLGMEGDHTCDNRVSNQKTLLVLLGEEIRTAIPLLKAADDRLLVSRTTLLWTSKALTAIKCDPQHPLLRMSLHGESPLPQALIQYACAHWEEYVDVIRHQTRRVFENLLRCHIVIMGGKSEDDVFLNNLLDSILELPWSNKSKYGPLLCLMTHLSVTALVTQYPRLPRNLLVATTEQTLAPYANELYDKLAIKHKSEMKQCSITVGMWRSVWVDPVLDLLEGSAGKLSLTWTKSSVYRLLLCLMRDLSVKDLVTRIPRLPRELLFAMTEQMLMVYAIDLYQSLSIKHKCEEQESVATLDAWQGVWVDPVLDLLERGAAKLRYRITEYTLPKLLTHSPEMLPYMVQTLSRRNHIGALITVLKRARMLALVSADVTGAMTHAQGDAQVPMWNGIVHIATVKRALCHPDEQVRLSALGILCENPKTTQVITVVDFDLLKFFLPLNVSSQLPTFRQSVTGLMKKFFMRLCDSLRVLRRTVKSASNRKSKAAGDSEQVRKLFEAEQSIKNYEEFLSWFVCMCFQQVHPGAGFPCRTTALSLLSEFAIIMATTRESSGVFYDLPAQLTPSHIQTLLECLTDTFDTNKSAALSILLSVKPALAKLDDKQQLRQLLEAGLQLSRSCRPQDCPTAAYVLRVLLHIPAASQLFAELLEGEDNCNSDHAADATFQLLQLLERSLAAQLAVAETNLLRAAAAGPMYPTLHCVNAVLQDTDLGTVLEPVRWRRLLTVLIGACFRVAAVVGAVVANSSPEGHLPPDSDIGSLEGVLAECQHDNVDIDRVRLMPEYLTVCCWRSIKEVSLLLGYLVNAAPFCRDTENEAANITRTLKDLSLSLDSQRESSLQDNATSNIEHLTKSTGDTSGAEVQCSDRGGYEDRGLLTWEQVRSVGGYFTGQLLGSVHRGAFELAYTGFVKMCERLWC